MNFIFNGVKLKMQTLLTDFATNLDAHLEKFLVYLVKRHRLNLDALKKDFAQFQAGKLEVLDGPAQVNNATKAETKKTEKTEPVKTASKIAALTKDDESEDEKVSEVKTKIKDALDSSADQSLHLNEDDDSSEEPIKPVNKTKPKIADPEESSDSAPAPKAKTDTKKGAQGKAKPAAKEEDSDDEAADDDEPAAKPAAKKGGKAKADEPKEAELVDKPKMTDGPKVPKNVQFVKGTNLAVVDGKVVSAYTKKGFVVLNKSHDKQIEKTGLEADAWDKDKVAKKLNK